MGCSEYIFSSWGSNIGISLLSLENPNNASQLIIFKYMCAWFALDEVVVNINLFLILSYDTLIILIKRFCK